MEHKLDLSEMVLCRKVGSMFEKAADEAPYMEEDFCKAWLQSSLCKAIQEMEVTIICQSYVYFWNTLRQDLDLLERPDYQMDRVVLYWAGYIFTYWMFYRGIAPEEIAKEYDFAEILKRYDVLHTMSNAVAVQIIEKECRIH